MGHQVIKLQNPLKTLGFLQFYRFKTVKDRIIPYSIPEPQFFSYFPYLVAGIMEQKINSIKQNRAGNAITAFPAPRIVQTALTSYPPPRMHPRSLPLALPSEIPYRRCQSHSQ